MVNSNHHKGSTNQTQKYLLFSFIFLLFGLTQGLLAAPQTISLMAYNLENMFDATNDGVLQGDVTFLPLSVKKKWKEDKCLVKEAFRRPLCETLDWTQEKYEARLAKVVQVLLSYGNNGADIISLEELENKNVTEDLWSKYLKWRGYQHPIHFESPSERGIDVAIISRFPLASSPIAHHVDLSGVDAGSTRDVLEATFQVGSGELLKVAANHWPSQNHTVEARIRAANVVKSIALKAQGEGASFISMGDFNTLPSETPNPIENYLADSNVKNLARPLVDLVDYLKGYPNFPHKGSHFYQGEWNPLDRIMVSKNMLQSSNRLRIDLASFGLHVPSYLLKTGPLTDPKTGEKKLYTFPYRFDFQTGEGYSDHLPVVVEILVK